MHASVGYIKLQTTGAMMSGNNGESDLEGDLEETQKETYGDLEGDLEGDLDGDLERGPNPTNLVIVLVVILPFI